MTYILYPTKTLAFSLAKQYHLTCALVSLNQQDGISDDEILDFYRKQLIFDKIYENKCQILICWNGFEGIINNNIEDVKQLSKERSHHYLIFMLTLPSSDIKFFFQRVK